MKNFRGLIQVYYGDGKGKTTAAMGQIVRSAGTGMRVVLVQFLKNSPSGELEVLRALENVTVFRGKAGKGFTFNMTDEEKTETIKIHNENLRQAWQLVLDDKVDLLVLDEVVDVYAGDFIDRKLVEEIITSKPDRLEIVATGHSLPDFFMEHGDYVTNMKKIKHPFDKKVSARKGIEY